MTDKKAKDGKKTTAPGLLGDILKAGKKLSGSKVAEAIGMASSIQQSEEAVATFIAAIESADQLAFQKLGFDKLEQEVKAEWYGLTLEGLKKHLCEWADSGETAAKAILDTLEVFQRSKVDVIAPLWRLVTEIIRPAREVRSYFDLSQLLRALRDKGLLETFMDRRHWPEKAIVLKGGVHSTGYLPAMERGKVITMMEAGWPFLKAAEERAKGWAETRRQELAEMERSAEDLTPDTVANDKEGNIFLKIGENAGALLRVTRNDIGCKVRIVRTLGLGVRSTAWIRWSDGADAWPDDRLFQAFELWKKRG